MFALLALLVSVAPADPVLPPTPLKVLMVCGGCCHDYTQQKAIISKGLAERAYIEVTTVQQGGTVTTSEIPLYKNPDWAKGYDLVIHDECFSDAKDPAWTKRILDPHRAGLPAVVLHCAMHSYRDGTDQWFEFCGVTSRRHGASYPHDVTNADPKHPIMRDFGTVWNNPAGELYWIEKVHPNSHVLASSRNRESGRDEVSVWTNNYRGKTRIFGTTVGHHNETVKDDAYLDLLTRGILWACDKLEPAYLKPKQPKTVRNNLSTGKRATASSEEAGKGNLAAKAIDNDSSTRWCASSPNAPEWLQVDLGNPETVTGVAVEWEASDAVYRHKVETSEDGKTWKVVADASLNNTPGSSEHNFKGKNIRHVRLTYFGSNTGSWASVRELAVYGDKETVVSEVDQKAAKDRKFLRETKIPEGYTATVFAAPPDVAYPVFVNASPAGDVYVSVDRNGSLDRALHRGSVVRLRDLDQDGRADESKLFVKDVDSPRGLVWDHDRLYLMHPPHLSAFIDHDGDGVSDEQRILVKNIAFGFKDRPADHTSNGVTLGIDGWLYLAIGDFGFMEAEGTDGRKLQLRGGGVVRVRPDGTGLEVYSRGTRNILEVSVDPFLNAFARDNTNDGGGWDIRLHYFSGLENHGYPSLYKNFNDESVQPLADYGGGSGCGGLFLDEPGFPKADSPALYTADWGREQVFRHRMKPSGATFQADQTEFLGLPRVTDLDVDAMSRLYASSWRGATFTYAGEDVGFLVQLRPRNFQPAALPNFDKTSRQTLVSLLNDPSSRRRLEAQRALLRQGIDGPTTVLLEGLAANDSVREEARVAAIFALKQGLKTQSIPILVKLAENPKISEFAIRALTDRLDERDDRAVAPIQKGLGSSNPRVVLASIKGLARVGRPEYARLLLPLLGNADPLIAHTAINALATLKGSEAAFQVVDDSNSNASSRMSALRSLQAMHDPRVVQGLIQRVRSETSQSRRAGLISALCRLHDREGNWKGESWGTRPDTSGPYYQAEAWSETTQITAALKEILIQGTTEEQALVLDQLRRHKIWLKDGLAPLFAKAETETSLIPGLVYQVANLDEVPAVAIPVLIKAARSASTVEETRALDLAVLAKQPSQAALDACLKGIPLLPSNEAGKQARVRIRNALLGSSNLAQYLPDVIQEASSGSGESSIWADMILLQLSGQNQTAAQAIEAGWKQPARKVQILQAIALAEHKPSADRVRLALKDVDPNVVASAREASTALRLEQPGGEKRPPGGPTVVALGIARTLDRVTQIKGNIALGGQVFNRLNCLNCHTVQPNDPPKGPFLGNIATTYKRRELAESILRPSKTLAQGFVTTAIALDDGSTVVGFIAKEGADSILLRTAEAKEINIPKNRIEERAKRDVSVMPEGLVNDLSIREFASLLDYLESLSKK